MSRTNSHATTSLDVRAMFRDANQPRADDMGIATSLDPESKIPMDRTSNNEVSIPADLEPEPAEATPVTSEHALAMGNAMAAGTDDPNPGYGREPSASRDMGNRIPAGASPGVSATGSVLAPGKVLPTEKNVPIESANPDAHNVTARSRPYAAGSRAQNPDTGSTSYPEENPDGSTSMDARFGTPVFGNELDDYPHTWDDRPADAAATASTPLPVDAKNAAIPADTKPDTAAASRNAADKTDPPRASPQAETKSPLINMAQYIRSELRDDIASFAEGAVSSGFDNLDKKAGKIFPWLYVVGATTGTGKTTFVLQMVTQMAEKGSHVLMFSLEQNAFELVSKCAARMMAEPYTPAACSAIAIRQNLADDGTLNKALDRLLAFSERITFYEGNLTSVTVDIIEKEVNRYIEKNHVSPVVVVDYLQGIRKSADDRSGTKEQIDDHIRKLKALQSKLKIIMIVISSFNRINYSSSASLASFKESGDIEYTADVVWALQLSVINSSDFKKTGADRETLLNEAMSAYPRKVELICLKNRSDTPLYRCQFDYYTKFDLFKPL